MENQTTFMSEIYTFEETLAMASGEDLQEYRKRAEFRSRISSESKKYLNKPVSDWPPITFNWDVSRESQIFSLDGVSEEDFQKYYPDGFVLGCVELAKFDRILGQYSRRDDGKLWELGSPSSLAYLIVYLSEGHPISPPLVKPIEGGEVIFQGGHHRYAIAKSIGERRIPIHVCPENKERIENLVSVEWTIL